MALSARLNEVGDGYTRHKPPADYKPGRHIIGDGGEVVTEATPDEVRSHDDLLRLAQLDPAEWKIADPNKIDARMWQRYDLEYLHYYKFPVVRRDATLDLPALFAAARRVQRAKTPEVRNGGRGAVVVWADPQTGKIGSRGGTPELIERVQEKQAALDAWLKKMKPDQCLFADVGDGVEGFESVAAQQFTNDLSLMDQLDIEATFEFDTIATMAKRAPTLVAKTTSNHSAWRNGKAWLGKPKDDWGIYLGHQLEKQFRHLPNLDVTFAYPHEWDHSMSVDFMGTIIGLHHGHLVSRPEGVPLWWAKQTHGAGAIADADILLVGHWHHLRIQPTGRNRITGKVKWLLQAPTLDNGSDWYRNAQGDDSDPGLLVFMVDEHGFDLSSLAVL